MELSFFRGKRVLVTGHTGFKGTWLCKVLLHAGAEVVGYGLSPLGRESLYTLCGIEEKIVSVIGDIRDLPHLKSVFEQTKPEIVVHLAAQPLVKEGYHNPHYTYETNIMGTVNVLECVRCTKSVKSFLNVTTDKVYENKEWVWGYRENEELGGFDPYANAKACSDLVTKSYCQAFFKECEVAISIARAGNVIGGGDFAKDRIIPDCVRAVAQEREIQVRNPQSIRPYQHVLEALDAYLLIIMEQFKDKTYAGVYNIGPKESDCITTGELVTLFCRMWQDGATWVSTEKSHLHESNFLKLDCSYIANRLGWRPKWDVDEAIFKTVEWSKAYLRGEAIDVCMDRQIKNYFN